MEFEGLGLLLEVIELLGEEELGALLLVEGKFELSPMGMVVLLKIVVVVGLREEVEELLLLLVVVLLLVVEEEVEEMLLVGQTKSII